MPPRLLGSLSLLLWTLACGFTFALAVDLQRPDGARLVVWMVWALDIFAALWTSRSLVTQVVLAEGDAADWRSRWGSEVGPHRLALCRLVWAIEEATISTGRPARVDAPDLLSRANRLTHSTRANTPGVQYANNRYLARVQELTGIAPVTLTPAP